ncbi:MAG: hypothetical protein Q9181_006023 [Wetmoreana brouardii]
MVEPTDFLDLRIPLDSVGFAKIDPRKRVKRFVRRGWDHSKGTQTLMSGIGGRYPALYKEVMRFRPHVENLWWTSMKRNTD